MIFLRLRPKLDFNYVKPCFDLFQFRNNFMTKGLSNYKTNPSDRKMDRQRQSLTDKQ